MRSCKSNPRNSLHLSVFITVRAKGSLRKEGFCFGSQSDVAGRHAKEATEARAAGRITFVVRDVSARLLLFRNQHGDRVLPRVKMGLCASVKNPVNCPQKSPAAHDSGDFSSTMPMIF